MSQLLGVEADATSQRGGVSPRITLSVLECAAAHGLDITPFTRLVQHYCPNYETFLPIGVHFQIWEAIMRTLRRPDLPILAGQQRSPEDLEERGFVLMTSETGWEACHRAINYAALTTTAGTWDLRTEKGLAWVLFAREGPQSLGYRASLECLLAACTQILRMVLGHDLSLHQVRLRHAAPPDIQAHLRFFGAPMVFGAEHNSLSFRSHYLDRHPTNASSSLRDYFDRVAERKLRALGGNPSLAERVQAAMLRYLADGPPQMPRVARDLAMSERSLRRALVAEGLGFAELLTHLRIQIADARLREPNISLSDVAVELGFADQSSFSRFYRRHRGRAPSKARTLAANVKPKAGIAKRDRGGRST